MFPSCRPNDESPCLIASTSRQRCSTLLSTLLSTLAIIISRIQFERNSNGFTLVAAIRSRWEAEISVARLKREFRKGIIRSTRINSNRCTAKAACEYSFASVRPSRSSADTCRPPGRHRERGLLLFRWLPLLYPLVEIPISKTKRRPSNETPTDMDLIDRN